MKEEKRVRGVSGRGGTAGVSTRKRKSLAKTPRGGTRSRKASTSTTRSQKGTRVASTATTESCRHCDTVDCTVHCPATKSGRHDVTDGDMEVVDDEPTVVLVELFCNRCHDRANAVVLESNFEWEGNWRDEDSEFKTRR